MESFCEYFVITYVILSSSRSNVRVGGAEVTMLLQADRWMFLWGLKVWNISDGELCSFEIDFFLNLTFIDFWIKETSLNTLRVKSDQTVL